MLGAHLKALFAAFAIGSRRRENRRIHTRRCEMRRRIAAIMLTGAFVLAVQAPAAFGLADKFGPGNGGGGGNAKCHPPGQTTDTPGCK
jgi:hypothetical protein